MAPIAASSRSVTYNPVNSAGPFPVGDPAFPVFDGSGADLFVSLNGEEVSGWTFSGTVEGGFYGAPNTWVNGSILFSAPITGKLVIDGARDPRRQDQFREGGGVPARDLNTALNTLTATDQEMRRDIGRTVRVPHGEDGIVIPPIAERADTVAGYDSNGDPVARTIAPGSGLFASLSDAKAGVSTTLYMNPAATRAAFTEPGGLTAGINSDAAFDPASGPHGYYSDYDCKGALKLVLVQNENQGSIPGGGFRDHTLIQHVDRDVVDYTAIGQKVSLGIRVLASGAYNTPGGTFDVQYKDIVAGDFHAIGRIGWNVRGVSGITAGAIQHGTGIASNEFAAENAAEYDQSSSMAGVQSIIRALKGADDGSHVYRAFLGTNQGHRITAGLQLHSAPLSGLYSGAFRYGLDFTLATIEEAAIRLRGEGSGATAIEFGPGSYTTFDRINSRLNAIIGSVLTTSVSPAGLAVGAAALGTTGAFLAIAPSTSGSAHLRLAPGATRASPANGDLWFDGSAVKICIGGVVRTFTVT